jgi:glycosyltransferase involved in cell wall biosynthesis
LKHKQKNVLFLTNIPAPYRVSFFNEFGKMCNLTVTFEGKSATDRDKMWLHEKISSFHAVFLKGIRTGTDHFFCPAIIKMLKRKWDAIIVGTYSTPTAMLAIEYMRFYHIKFFIEADGGLIKKDGRIRYWIKHHLISSANGWFSSGSLTTDYLVHYGADREKCFCFPFTSLKKEDIAKKNIPSAKDREMVKKQLGIIEKYMIFSVGRFAYENGYGKGFDNLMYIAEQAGEEIGFYIAGDEPTEKFAAWKRNKKLTHVHFIAFQEKEMLEKYYIAADVFILLTRGDVWGLSINEAMANALPVITTDRCIAGIELVEQNKNGFIISAEDWKKAAECIEKLIQNQNLRETFGECSYEKICSYTIENMSLEHIKILVGDYNPTKLCKEPVKNYPK